MVINHPCSVSSSPMTTRALTSQFARVNPQHFAAGDNTGVAGQVATIIEEAYMEEGMEEEIFEEEYLDFDKDLFEEVRGKHCIIGD